MASLNTETLKAPRDEMTGNIDPSDAREIVMDKDVGDRKAGKTYIVDSALAAHYCDAVKVARPVETKKLESVPELVETEQPGEANDRAMQPPPRGRGRPRS